MLNFDGSSSAPNAMIRSSGTPGRSRDIDPAGPSVGATEVALDHLDGESVDAGGHRGMRGEHGRRAHHSECGVEVQAGVGQLADALHAQEPGVTFVHVEYLRGGQALDGGERADRAHAADAGQDLLLDPVFLVAAVEPVGDAAQVVVVLRDVGVQEQQRDSADLRDPDPGA